ncbi:alpha/beta fold hydrolase [Stappia sp.]|uniref:alpha/beta fold hydrolase n=1 Tax=Stappia sp. TaxID=1870903 RepID=UPI003A9983B0
MAGEAMSTREEQLAAFDTAFPKAQLLESPLSFRRASPASGQAVMLLPGASGTSEFFCLVASLLREGGCDPVLVDYPGTIGPRALARETEKLAVGLGLAAPVAVGCSYSAWWLQHAATSAPFAALILCNGFVEAEDLKGHPLFDHAAIAATPAAELREQWRERAAGGPSTPLSGLLLKAMTGWLAAEDLKGRLMQVTASRPVPGPERFGGPVTVIDCPDDPIVTAPARARFRETWSNASHRQVPGGHYPYVNAPEDFARAVLSSI